MLYVNDCGIMYVTILSLYVLLQLLCVPQSTIIIFCSGIVIHYVHAVSLWRTDLFVTLCKIKHFLVLK